MRKKDLVLWQSLRNILVGFVMLVVSYSVDAQTVCNHLTLNYNVNQWYYALGINNTSLEESSFTIEINNATYLLDGSQFSTPNGIQLRVTTTSNINGTYDHLITPDQTIAGYQYLNFVYSGVPAYTNNNFSATSVINCTFDYVPLCSNLDFNFYNQGQYYFGFSVQNDNSVDYYPYEVHIDNANFQFDPTQLNHSGFDFHEVDNGNGTYDYYFLAQNPISGYSSSPTVSTTQNLGAGASSNGAEILCGNLIVSSGVNAGLESHGGLSSKIALRNFKRALGRENKTVLRTNPKIISDLAPEHIVNGDLRLESTPADLVEFTAAETVWAGDYYINDTRIGSVFGTKTSDVIYDHTKVICDRVKGSELVAVEVVNIGGYETILSIIRQPNNAIEYAISFSLAYEDYGDFNMASNWAIDEYAKSPHFLNYQVWTNSKAKSIAAVQRIIDNINTANGYKLHSAAVSPVAPKLFARRAHYRLGAFHIELNNSLSEPKMVQISGTYNSKEIGGEVFPFNQELVVVPGQTSLKLDIPGGNIFDGEITLRTGSNQKDVIYLADGAWGLEYEDNNTTIDNVEIISDQRTDSEDVYLVERGIEVRGTTDTYISIFKQLKPGGLAIDLSAYNTLSFDTEREGVYEVTLLMADITDPSLNVSYTLETDAASRIDIPLAFFSNAEGVQLDASLITTIYIAFTAVNNERSDFDFRIENIRFRNDESSNLVIDPLKLNLYPNPTDGLVYLTHMFSQKSEVVITVCDSNGIILEQTTQTAYKGLQSFQLQMINNVPGIYFVSLETAEGVYTNSVLLGQ